MNDTPIRLKFPTMLRKMWSGGEVQAWLDELPNLFVAPVKDREKDRLHFPDEAFNRWLDESISDSGHIVYDEIPDICCAWYGWFNREFYAPSEADTLQSLRSVIIQQQAEIAHLKELFGCDPAYFEVSKK